MMLETVMRPMVAFQEIRLPKKLPNLWTELGTVAKQQLAFSWAQLIVRAAGSEKYGTNNSRNSGPFRRGGPEWGQYCVSGGNQLTKPLG
jgi:hypothetical protein